jgi:lysophospholipase L1-like esterase
MFYFALGSFCLVVTGPQRTWVVGDSIVYWAGLKQADKFDYRRRSKPEQHTLQGGGEVSWFGIRGAHVAGLAKRLGGLLKLHKSAFPTTIIFHIGTNDVFNCSTIDMKALISDNLWGVRGLLPDTRVIWSNILPRLYYYMEQRRGGGKRIARYFNAQARKVICEMGNAHTVRHSEVLSPRNQGLFRPDGLHLRDEGLTVFRMNLSESLLFFNMKPWEKAFPPAI